MRRRAPDRANRWYRGGDAGARASTALGHGPAWWHCEVGSAPWHYVLGPIGAALLGQEDREEKKWLPQVRADRQLALERSQRLGHMTGANWFFVALARHAREHGGGELRAWLSEQEVAGHGPMRLIDLADVPPDPWRAEQAERERRERNPYRR